MSQNYTISEILQKIKEIFCLCKENQDTYKNNKDEMLKMVARNDTVFYNKHYRICRTIVYEDDISDLLIMIEKFHKIKINQKTLEDADKEIANKYNSKYVNPILNKKELVEERENKMKQGI